MSEKSIRLTTDEVRAILNGRKTQKRTIIKGTKDYEYCSDIGIEINPEVCINGDLEVCKVLNGTHAYFTHKNYNDLDTYIKLPYQVGDILWVRETWRESFNHPATEYEYRADALRETDKVTPFTWRASIHMPREAARIFLKVTNVRVERLQDITEDDAKKEGVKDPYDYQQPEYYEQPHMRGLEINKSAFAGLWDSIYENWADNPWVWCISFEREERDAAKQNKL